MHDFSNLEGDDARNEMTAFPANPSGAGGAPVFFALADATWPYPVNLSW